VDTYKLFRKDRKEKGRESLPFAERGRSNLQGSSKGQMETLAESLQVRI